MNTRVLAVANQKGGVGKTTTSINLAACLVERRRRVLLIDLDPQSNATSGLGAEKTPGASLYRALVAGGTLEPSIRKTAYARFDLVPSELDLAGAEVDFVTAPDYQFRLRNLLRPVRESGAYDYIFIDCPPSLGVLTINALVAADAVLIPLQTEYFALEGLGTLTGILDQLRRNGDHPELELDGIVMTMYDGRTRLAQQVVAEVFGHFGGKVYQSMIPRTVRLGEAPGFGKPIIVYDRQGTGAAAYRMLAREFLRRNEPVSPPPPSDYGSPNPTNRTAPVEDGAGDGCTNGKASPASGQITDVQPGMNSGGTGRERAIGGMDGGAVSEAVSSRNVPSDAGAETDSATRTGPEST